MPAPPFGRYRVTADTIRRPVRDGPFEPRFEVADEVYGDVRAIERADQDLRRFRVDAAEARRLLEDALTRNAYGTASIEGNPLTLEDVESLLARGPTPDAMIRPEEREILNYVNLVRRLPDVDPPRSAQDLLDLHATLFEGVLPDAGAFKQQVNFVGKRPEFVVTFIPAHPDRVVPELDRALAWFHDAPEHPLVKIMILFHEVQSIHPFRDGNGRAGRALTTTLLHHLGYEGVRYALVDYGFNADRENYYAHLQQTDRERDFTPWVRYMSGVLRDGFEGAVQRFLFREGLPEELNERQVKVAEWFARMHREKPERRVKFNDVHAAFPQVANRTLKRDLQRLRDTGVIEMQGTRKAASYRMQE